MMDRREFLAAASSLALPGFPIQDWKPRGEKPRGAFDLVVVKGKEPAKMVPAGLDALGIAEKFIAKGDNVLVKPNIAWDRSPEQAANTHPEVVSALCRWALGAGAKSVTVADATVDRAARTYEASGIKAAAESAGAKAVLMGRFVKVPMGGKAVPEWEAWADYPSFDKVINVPIGKHHGTTQLTMCIKNYLGLVGGNRGALHKSMDDSLTDLAAFFAGLRPTLHVLDAVRILLRGGPKGGKLEDVRETGTIALGFAPATVDAFGVTLFGKAPGSIGHVKTGSERGLGTLDLKAVRTREIQA